MTKQATIEDFSTWLDFHLEEAAKAIQVDVTKIESQWASKGALGSGRYPVYLVESVEKGFRSSLDTVLGECRRAGRVTNLPSAELRAITEDKLRCLLSRAKEPLDRPSLSPEQRGTLAPLLCKLDQHLTFALRQFDVGRRARGVSDHRLRRRR